MLALERRRIYNQSVLVEERHRSAIPAGARCGGLLLGAGVVLDIPPHLLPGDDLAGLALAGHLVVLAGMVVVLATLARAMAAARHRTRRSP